MNMWQELAIAYGAGYFVTLMTITRIWYTKRCEDNCTRIEDSYHGRHEGKHTENCGRLRRKASEPDEALWYAIAWPICIVYIIAMWNYMRAPVRLPYNRQRRTGLSQADLDKLDKILYSNGK